MDEKVVIRLRPDTASDLARKLAAVTFETPQLTEVRLELLSSGEPLAHVRVVGIADASAVGEG